MNIHEILHRIKGSPEIIEFNEKGEVERFSFLRKFFLSLVIILVALASFGLGRLSGTEKREPIQIRYENLDSQLTTDNPQPTTSKIENSASVTASSKGSKYYPAGCKSTISSKNKISFQTAAAAEAAGYTLAATCKNH